MSDHTLREEFEDGYREIRDSQVITYKRGLSVDRKIAVRVARRFPVLHPDGYLPSGILFSNNPSDIRKLLKDEVLGVIVRLPYREELLSVCKDIKFTPFQKGRWVEYATVCNFCYYDDHNSFSNGDPSSAVAFMAKAGADPEAESTKRAFPYIQRAFRDMADGLSAMVSFSPTYFGGFMIYHPGTYGFLHSDESIKIQGLITFGGETGTIITTHPATLNVDETSYPENPPYSPFAYEIALGDILYLNAKLVHAAPVVARPADIRWVGNIRSKDL